MGSVSPRWWTRARRTTSCPTPPCAASLSSRRDRRSTASPSPTGTILPRQVPVLVGDEPFSIDCVGIALGCYDFILGLDFLSTLGPILWDLDVLSLIFWREGG